ncbi:MAG: hypothetical protein ACRYG7_19960 [Janthinobacterium lividum]
MEQKSTQLSWGALYSNIGLNGAGILTIFNCNVLHQGCEGLYLYFWAALFLGVPLFLITLFVAPTGAFRVQGPASSKRYRRLFLLNLGLVALIFIPASIATFLR